MSKPSPKAIKSGRLATSGQFVVLKDGRKLVAPPSGGELKKSEIRKAVTAVVTERRMKAG